jgi:glutaconate CoA-transferase subunit B
MFDNPGSCTTAEFLAVMASRALKDGQIVFAGVGTPLLAATLAQRLHAPGLTILFEGGVIGPFIVPGELPPSTNEQRCTRRANMVLPITDVLLLLQRGYVDIGFLGGAQIDCYGNINSSFIGDPDHPKTRLPGTGGGNDIASLSQVMVVMKHEKRRFVKKVEFITSPGYLTGGSSRRDAGLLSGGPQLIITDLAELDFHPETKRMQIQALHPGVTKEQVQANTDFELGVGADIHTTEPPTERELRILRKLDPDRLYTA